MSDSFLIRNAQIVDVGGGSIETDRSVLVRGDHIEAVGRFPGWSGASMDAGEPVPVSRPHRLPRPLLFGCGA